MRAKITIKQPDCFDNENVFSYNLTGGNFHDNQTQFNSRLTT
jgi:hypothetical protein